MSKLNHLWNEHPAVAVYCDNNTCSAQNWGNCCFLTCSIWNPWLSFCKRDGNSCGSSYGKTRSRFLQSYVSTTGRVFISNGNMGIPALLGYACSGGSRWAGSSPLQPSPSFLPVSPKIFRISSDIVVNEGSNVTLVCLATGKPEPSISWRHISPSGKHRAHPRLSAAAHQQQVSQRQVSQVWRHLLCDTLKTECLTTLWENKSFFRFQPRSVKTTILL